MKKNMFAGTFPVFGFGATLLLVCAFALTRSTIDTVGKIFLGIFLVLGLFLLWIGGTIVAKNKKQYQEFFAVFPELEDQPDLLEKEASFMDKKLGLAFYKGILFTYNRGVFSFSFADLREADGVAYRYVHSNMRKTNQPPTAFLDIHFKEEERPVVSLEIPPLVPGVHDVEGHLRGIYMAIQQEFPNIQCQ